MAWRHHNIVLNFPVLVRNARISQAVIEEHYETHLTTAQARKSLHSFLRYAHSYPGSGMV